MVSIAEGSKPSQATWIAKMIVNPDGSAEAVPAPPGTTHQLAQVEVAWYGEDRIKVTIKEGGPAVIRQAYLTGAGRPVIIDLVAQP
jgi:hypothetical protein